MFLANKPAAEYYSTLRAQLARSMSLATWLSRIVVTGAGRALTPFALSLFPNAMPWIAACTRIPQPALLGAISRRIAAGRDTTPQRA